LASQGGFHFLDLCRNRPTQQGFRRRARQYRCRFPLCSVDCLICESNIGSDAFPKWLVRDEREAHTGINQSELARLWRRLQPLAIDRMPFDVAPPRSTRFVSPLVISRVHWVRPELVAEVKFLTWTEDNLLRQVVYEGLREDNRARGPA
jgi:ATP dependent DNA ligase C terminal region